MRLNRVLLLAAAINILIVALVFTSCSGENGKDGKPGENSCYVIKQDGAGWDVFCGDEPEPIGRLRGPGDGPGPQGEPGNPGANGKDGAACQAKQNATTKLTDIYCDNKLAGTLDACSILPIDDFSSTISCPSKGLSISLCGGVAIDTAQYFCLGGTVTSAADKEVTCGDGTKADARTQYCAKPNLSASSTRAYFCGGSDGRLMLNKVDSAALSSASDCKNHGGIWAKNGNSTEKCWFDAFIGRGDYCQVLNAAGTKFRVARDGTENQNGIPYDDNLPPYCGTGSSSASKYRYNEDRWKGEYCGYQQNAAEKKVSTGLCNDFTEFAPSANDTSNPKGFGPNQKAWNMGYCQADRNGRTSYTEVFCEDGKPFNSGSWKFEYCGFAGSSGSAAVVKTVIKGICDQSNSSGIQGPDEEAYGKGYCTVLLADKLTGKSTYTDKYCRPSTGANAIKTTAPYRLNEKTWKGEYCGYANAAAGEAATKYPDTSSVAVAVKRLKICDDGQGPLAQSYDSTAYCQANKEGVTTKVNGDASCGDGSPINSGSWQGEYCGYASATAETTSKLKGACETGKGPNYEKYNGGYCRAFPGDSISYENHFCGESGTINKDTYQNQYCGKNEADVETVYSGVCDDGITGPNTFRFGGGYCRVMSASADSTATAYSDKFCGPDSAKTTINELVWKGEYCFDGDNKTGYCTGGRKPNLTKKSTDPITVRCDFPSGFICTADKLNACDKAGCNSLNTEEAVGFQWIEAVNECRVLEGG